MKFTIFLIFLSFAFFGAVVAGGDSSSVEFSSSVEVTTETRKEETLYNDF